MHSHELKYIRIDSYILCTKHHTPDCIMSVFTLMFKFEFFLPSPIYFRMYAYGLHIHCTATFQYLTCFIWYVSLHISVPYVYRLNTYTLQ